MPIEPASDVAAGADASSPLIDLHDKGIGDAVVACWLIHSARARGLPVRLNPRGLDALCALLDVTAPAVTLAEGTNWAKTDGLGHRHEYGLLAQGRAKSRFAAWADALGLPPLAPVRPPYRESAEEADWAEAAWRESGADAGPRVAIFPESAWLVRQWPTAYFMDLADALKVRGATVLMVGGKKQAVDRLGCRWYAGFAWPRSAALMARADAVIGNDSGPAHLAGTIGVPTFALTGPTDGALVFDHDPNVRWLGLPPGRLACHPCHYSTARGHRQACEVGGCQALMTLTPDQAFAAVWPWLRAARARRG